ncbi:LysR family transcriptional regulator [Streptomyces sp. Da 82-17]|uniref:LysR family transcriptional regulator n=1 Tax=Streptomyces sp. Da 82-17 TaxID=3377116 RepID=UPI0038D4BF90
MLRPNDPGRRRAGAAQTVAGSAAPAPASGPASDPASGSVPAPASAPSLDLDLAQVRAFAAVARTLHFAVAAEELGLTQQAVSKRIARLEERLGARLLERGRGMRAGLTEAGERFLGPARQALSAGERAVTAARDDGRRPLRIDVWGHLYAPLRILARLAADEPRTGVDPGTGRDFPSVADAVRRGDIDAGLGRVPVLDPHAATGLAQRLVRLEPVDAVLSADHPLAAADRLRPADLRDSVLRYPADLARLDFLNCFARRFGVRHRLGATNLGLDPFLDQVRSDPGCFSLFPADAVSADAPGVRFVPLVEPTPLYAWSLVWPEGREPDRIGDLLAACARVGDRRRWTEFDAARDWLPGPSTD